MRDDDSPRRPKTSYLPLVLILLGIAFLGCIVVGVGGVLFYGIMVPRKITPAPVEKSTDPKRQPIPREDLRKKVMGKTKEEVIELFGKPDRTHESDDSWLYWNLATDPVSGKTDLMTYFYFKNNKVTRVTF